MRSLVDALREEVAFLRERNLHPAGDENHAQLLDRLARRLEKAESVRRYYLRRNVENLGAGTIVYMWGEQPHRRYPFVTLNPECGCAEYIAVDREDLEPIREPWSDAPVTSFSQEVERCAREAVGGGPEASCALRGAITDDVTGRAQEMMRSVCRQAARKGRGK